MNTKVSHGSKWKFLLVAVLIVGAAAVLIYYRTRVESIVLNPPLRGQVKEADDFDGFSDLYDVISSMKGYDVSYDEFMKILTRWGKMHGGQPVQYGQIHSLDFAGLIFKDAGYDTYTKVYAGKTTLHLAVFGKWVDDKLHLIAIFKYSGIPDMDDSPDFMGFRWWDSFFAVDRATGYVHMKYVMGTSTVPKGYFDQPVPSTGLPATAYYTKFYERYIRRQSIWWGNYLVNTDMWYADWGVLYVVLSPIEDFHCSSVSFDFIHSFMSSGLDIDFHQVMGQVDVVLNPPKGSTSYYLPLKVCKPQ